MVRRFTLLLAFFFVCAAVPTAHAAEERCFPETSYCMSGPIREYWERNGGLAVFGYPVGEQHIETNNDGWTGMTQWFERDRLEDHQGQGVMAGRLGAYYLELQERPWTQGTEAPQPARNLCTLFDVTGYNMCPPFSTYWRKNGGLERFGYPISPMMREQVEGKEYLVQYYERRRLEWHVENSGTPYEVLLGLLGRDINESLPCAPNGDRLFQQVARAHARELGCPNSAVRAFERLVVQQYEHGAMIWVAGTSSAPPMIFVLSAVPNQMYSTWKVYTDTYVEGEPVGGGEAPPPGRFAPMRGFGKIWWNNQPVRNALGWALTNELPNTGTVGFYNNGGRLITQGQTQAYTLLPNERVEIFLPQN